MLVEIRGNTLLHRACYNGRDAIVSLLLEMGADPTITDNNGKTPLQIAQENNKQSCVVAIELFQ
jgi:ankyrin repeat protein